MHISSFHDIRKELEMVQDHGEEGNEIKFSMWTKSALPDVSVSDTWSHSCSISARLHPWFFLTNLIGEESSLLFWFCLQVLLSLTLTWAAFYSHSFWQFLADLSCLLKNFLGITLLTYLGNNAHTMMNYCRANMPVYALPK
jgi:hypothetical protein